MPSTRAVRLLHASAAAVVLFAVLQPTARAASAADDVCATATTCYTNGSPCDRATQECPKCLYHDSQRDVFLCRDLRTETECGGKYTLCSDDTTVVSPPIDGSVAGEAGGSSTSSGAGSNTPAGGGGDTTVITSSEGSSEVETPSTFGPTTIPPDTPAPTQAPQVPNETAKASASTSSQASESSFPSWVIIVLGVVVGAGVAAFASVLYKRRRAMAQNQETTLTPFEDDKYEFSKRDFTPNNNGDDDGHSHRMTFDSQPSPSHQQHQQHLAPPQGNKNLRPQHRDNSYSMASGASGSLAPPQQKAIPPFRQPSAMAHPPPPQQPAHLRDSYATMLPRPQATTAATKPHHSSSATKPQLPPFQPGASGKRTAAGWGAKAPSPTAQGPPSPCMPSRAPPPRVANKKHQQPSPRDSWATNDCQTNDFHDEFATNNFNTNEFNTNDFHDEFASKNGYGDANDFLQTNVSFKTNDFHDEFATLDGNDDFINTSKWLDTNYMDVDTLRPSGDGDDEAVLFTVNSTSAGTDLYTSLGGDDDDMITMTRRRHSDDHIDDVDVYPDTSLQTTTTGGPQGIFALDSMRARDTATFHSDEIIDLSRREGGAEASPPAIGRKKETKQKVAKWKNKYYLEL